MNPIQKSLEFYILGLDYVFQWPERPVQFAFGAEAGSVQLLPKGMNSIDAGTAKLGWELHGEAMHYFVFRNQLVHAYVRLHGGFINLNWKQEVPPKNSMQADFP